MNCTMIRFFILRIPRSESREYSSSNRVKLSSILTPLEDLDNHSNVTFVVYNHYLIRWLVILDMDLGGTDRVFTGIHKYGEILVK